MTRVRHIVCGIVVILFVVTACEAKEWRGLVPLHSTRVDVVRLLGRSIETNDIRSMYRLAREDVYVVFSGKQFCSHETTKVPAGTVLLIQVTPRDPILISDLHVDKKRMREFSPSSQDPDWNGFIDEEEGLIVRSFKEKVDKIFYIAAAKDRGLCPSYYAQPEKFAGIVMDFFSGAFEQYSDLSFVDEKARLDNFAIYLQKDKPTWKAYVMGYPVADGLVAARARTNQ